MDCTEYRQKYKVFGVLPLPKEVWDTPECDAWTKHSLYCTACSDWTLYQRVRERGFAPEDYPCVHIAYHVTNHCDECSGPTDCSDLLISHSKRFDEYGIANLYGDSSVLTIRFCPWCGVRLPESKRDRWFEELRALGVDPWDDEIPGEYLTDEWYRKNK